MATSTTARRDLRRLQRSDALLSVADQVYPIEPADVERAKSLLLGLTPLSARDALHIAIMERYDIARVLSFDAGFDAVPWIERIGAKGESH